MRARASRGERDTPDGIVRDQSIRFPQQSENEAGITSRFHLRPVSPYRHAIRFVNKVGKEQTAIVHAHITSIMAQRFRWRGPPVGRRYRRGSIMIAWPRAMRFESDGGQGASERETKGMAGCWVNRWVLTRGRRGVVPTLTRPPAPQVIVATCKVVPYHAQDSPFLLPSLRYQPLYT